MMCARQQIGLTTAHHTPEVTPNDQTTGGPSSSQKSATASSYSEDDIAFLEALAAYPLTPCEDVRSSQRGGNASRNECSTPTLTPTPTPQRQRLPSGSSHSSFVDLGDMTQWRIADTLESLYMATRHCSTSSCSKANKRARFTSPEREAVDPCTTGQEIGHTGLRDAQASVKSNRGVNGFESSAYEALRFGDFVTYMRNKRAKLKIQEHSLQDQEKGLLTATATSTSRSPEHAEGQMVAPEGSTPIFKGCTIYVNGHTQPSYQELRRLIVLHGGNFMAYLDQKKPVTHIIASNLTPKKREEFAAYKIVRSEWVVQCIAAGKQLSWQKFRVEADADSAIGSERLPLSGKALLYPTSTYSAHSCVLVSPDVPTDKPNEHLTDVRLCGRAIAQKKLTVFQQQKRQATRPDTALPLRGDEAKADGEPSTVTKLQAQRQQEKVPECLELQPDSPKNKDLWKPIIGAKPSVPSQDPEGEQQSQTDQQAVSTIGSSIIASQEHWLACLQTPLCAPADSLPARTEVCQDSSAIEREAAIGTDAVSRVAAQASGYFKRHHPYATRSSNVDAARLLASPSWRERNTATSKSFLAGYFAKSRLHYLSTWKGELKDLVSQALRDAGREEGSRLLPKGVVRVIMHIDFDSFFVSVGLRHRPDLKDQPVVVCHAGLDDSISRARGTSSTSEIASCNYLARKYGIRNGWSLGRARQLCPRVQTISYDFEGYKDVSIQFYSFLLAHVDAIEVVSVDEALVDVSHLLQSMRTAAAPLSEPGEEDEERQALLMAYKGHTNSQGEKWTEEKQLAEALRDEIRHRTGCEASIGIGANTLQARLATRRAKPGGSFHLRAEEVETFLSELDVKDLPGVGYNTRHRFLAILGTTNIGELKQKATSGRLVAELGPRLGKQVWDKMHGIDRAELEGAKQRQSVGAAVNYAIRFINQEEAKHFLQNLSNEVANRLTTYKLKSRQINATIMVRNPNAPTEAPKFLGHGICNVHRRSCPMSGPAGVATNDAKHIFRGAWRLVKGLKINPTEFRGIGISCKKLEPVEGPSPVKPRAGQTLLNFQKTSPATDVPLVTLSQLAMQTDIAQELGDEDEVGLAGELAELTPGPVKSMARDAQKPIIPSVRVTNQLEVRNNVRQRYDECSHTPFLLDRAYSAEPVLTASQVPEQKSFAVSQIVPEPSRPVEASMRRSARVARTSEIAIPTTSQLDPSVLSEIPSPIRDEAFHESRRADSRSNAAPGRRQAVNQHPIPEPKLAPSGLESESARQGTSWSFSASPFKRQMAMASKKHSPSNQQRLLQFPFGTRNQPKVHKAGIWAMDPSRVTRAELKSLDIDANVFAELPLSMQREALIEQSRAVKGREARFVSGQYGVERSLAEERRLEADKARDALDAPPRYLVAAQRNKCDREPAIQQCTSFEDVSELLRTWVSRHQARTPRDNDVAKFSRFLTASAEMSNGLEKVEMLLKTWRALIADVKSDAQDGRGWEEAYREVKTAVDQVTRRRWGGVLDA